MIQMKAQSKRHISVLLLVLCLVANTAIAENAVFQDEFSTTIVDCQIKWDALYAEHYDSLSAEEQFAGHFLFDGIGMMSETDTEMVNRINDCSTLEDVKSIINNGFVDTSAPNSEPMNDVLARLQDVLEADGLTMPECYYIQHFAIGNYERTDGWDCYLGNVANDRDELVTIRYHIYLSGKDMKVMEYTTDLDINGIEVEK